MNYKGRVTSWMPQAVTVTIWITKAGQNLGYTGRSQFGLHRQVTIWIPQAGHKLDCRSHFGFHRQITI
jgi:hypothetical protein